MRRASVSLMRCRGAAMTTSTAPTSAASAEDQLPGSGRTISRRSRATPSSPTAASPRSGSPTTAVQAPEVDGPAATAIASDVAPEPRMPTMLPRRNAPSGNSGASGPSTGRVCPRQSHRCDPFADEPKLGATGRRIRPLVELDGEVSSVPRCHRASIEHMFASWQEGERGISAAPQRFTPPCDSMSPKPPWPTSPGRAARPSSICSSRTVEARSSRCRSTLVQPAAGSTPTTEHRSATSSS